MRSCVVLKTPSNSDAFDIGTVCRANDSIDAGSHGRRRFLSGKAMESVAIDDFGLEVDGSR